MKNFRIMVYSLIITIAITIMMLFGSCTTTKYVPVETVRTEVQYKDRVQKDSVHILDSVFMSVKGDTVFRDKWRIVYRDKFVRDTAYINRTDSVQVPYPVEKSLTKWQQFKMDIGGWAFGVIILLVLVFVCWLVLYKKRNSII